MTTTKVLFIGDIHVKHANIEDINLLIRRVSSVEAHLAVLAGDLLDTHEKIDTQLMNKAYDLVKALRKQMPVYILVGNHDYINNQQFLTENHWMNGMKEWVGVTVVDSPCIAHRFAFVPYVPPGRFMEALNRLEGWDQVLCIFAHQEFKGCKMGAIVSTVGDEWPPEAPLVISGHIHEPQQPQKNIVYPGSSINHSFGYDAQGVSVFEFEFRADVLLRYVESKLELGLPKKHIVYISVDQVKAIPPSHFKKTTKFNVEGNLEEIKAFKETAEYKKMKAESKVSLKITTTTPQQQQQQQQRFARRSFQTILDTMILTSQNDLLINDYKTLISSEQ